MNTMFNQLTVCVCVYAPELSLTLCVSASLYHSCYVSLHLSLFVQNCKFVIHGVDPVATHNTGFSNGPELNIINSQTVREREREERETGGEREREHWLL